MGALPIVPEHGQQFGRQHDIAIFAAFALVNPNDHALAIDRGGLEADGFGNPQTGRVTDGQKHAVLQDYPPRPGSARLRPCSEQREAFSPYGWREYRLRHPWPFEGNGVEKPERGDRDDDRAGCEVSLLRQVDQIGPDLGRPEMFRRFAKMAGEPNDLLDIHTLRVRCRLRICISSIIRRRSGLMDNSSARWTAPHGAGASSRD